MTQIAVKLPEQLLATVDQLVGKGRYANRSQAVRAALEALVRQDRAEQIGQAFARGFALHPERDDELTEAHRLAEESIHDEPWERWW